MATDSTPDTAALPKIGDRVTFKGSTGSQGEVVGYRVIVRWDEIGESECSPEHIEVLTDGV